MTSEFLAPVIGAATRTVHRRMAVASAIAGLIVAAIVLMTPNLIFERFIVATGLPGMVEAAAPPLGVKARLVFAALSAGGVTAIAFAALSIGVAHTGSGRPKRSSAEDEFFAYTPPAPRRRADIHPDSPPRPPINAGDDLGTPLDLVELAPDSVASADADESEPLGREEKEGFPVSEPAQEPEAAEEPSSTEPHYEDVSLSVEADIDEKREPDKMPVEEWVPSVPSPSLSNDQAFGPVEPRAAERPSAAVRGELSDLVGRLEAGIERRRTRAARAANDAEEPQATVTPHPTTPSGQDRELQGALRDALDALQKLNAGG